jgi:hypothetical protein
MIISIVDSFSSAGRGKCRLSTSRIASLSTPWDDGDMKVHGYWVAATLSSRDWTCMVRLDHQSLVTSPHNVHVRTYPLLSVCVPIDLLRSCVFRRPCFSWDEGSGCLWEETKDASGPHLKVPSIPSLSLDSAQLDCRRVQHMPMPPMFVAGRLVYPVPFGMHVLPFVLDMARCRPLLARGVLFTLDNFALSTNDVICRFFCSWHARIHALLSCCHACKWHSVPCIVLAHYVPMSRTNLSTNAQTFSSNYISKLRVSSAAQCKWIKIVCLRLRG